MLNRLRSLRPCGSSKCSLPVTGLGLLASPATPPRAVALRLSILSNRTSRGYPLWTSLDARKVSFCYTYAMKILHRSKKNGFTLIELMVVIAIIAILTGIIITGLVASKAKSRDAKRASDLSQIALAVEQYFDRCYQYPIPNAGKIDSTLLTQGIGVCPTNNNVQVTFGNFISVIPTDPSTGAGYDYVTNTTNTDFVLHT